MLNEVKRKVARCPSFAHQIPKNTGYAKSLLQLDVSNCEKPTGISRDCTKRMSPQAHGKPTRAHRRIGLKAMCSHKCREDKTITLIVAKSPQIDLVVL